jgi:putative salt-induced outer membrane protein YdiY
MLMKRKPAEQLSRAVHPICLAALLFLTGVYGSQSSPIVLHLKSGDRITGELVSENEVQLVVQTAWAGSLTIQRDLLERIELLVVAAAPTAPAVSTNTSPSTDVPTPAVAMETNAPASAQTAVANAPARKPDEWKFDIKLGADMIRGERDRDVFFGQAALTYAHPYPHEPKKFFRNRLDYRADYSTVDGSKSANRMSGANKTDFDFFEHAYFYNYFGGGYDEVRRINGQYEVGPGVGYHLFRQPKFVANIESGLTYQYQDRELDGELESIYARFAQDITWKLAPKITLTQRSALLVSLEEVEELQLRLEGNLSFGLVQNVSLNLTAIELYDTRPVTGVSPNEFQLRSAIGLTF